jgi:DNA-binding NarL/FixJ family response regulator
VSTPGRSQVLAPEPFKGEGTSVNATLDYEAAFHLAPVGLVLSRQRQMVDCNQELLAMFRATREQIIGSSFEILYPSSDEFERTGQRIAAQLDASGRYADERVMRRLAGSNHGDAGSSGELFWCHVSGRALNPQVPHEAGIWVFEDLSSQRVLKLELTPREREIAALLIQGLTSKGVGRRLDISPRTVDVYRARLMRKTGAATTTELVHKLLHGQL